MLHNKIILITGGTSGIGRATVCEALEQGAVVYFTGRNQSQADELITELSKKHNPDHVTFVLGDITDEASIQSTIQRISQEQGRLDAVFANAGRHMVGTVVDTTLEQWRDMFRVDVEGVFLTLKYSIPLMQQSGGGSIVLMGSDQCLIGKGSSSAYGAAKGAIGQLTKSTAIDYAVDNIRVNCVCPGTIDTPLARGAMQGFADQQFGGDFQAGYEFLSHAQPIQRLGTSEEVARLVVFMLSDQCGFMTGSLVSVDGGYVAG